MCWACIGLPSSDNSAISASGCRRLRDDCRKMRFPPRVVVRDCGQTWEPDLTGNEEAAAAVLPVDPLLGDAGGDEGLQSLLHSLRAPS